MNNKKESTPKDYDRWEKTCVKFNDEAPKKTEKATRKVVKTVKKGK